MQVGRWSERAMVGGLVGGAGCKIGNRSEIGAGQGGRSDCALVVDVEGEGGRRIRIPGPRRVRRDVV